MSNSVCFRNMYGYCAPDLKEVAWALTLLGCRNECAKRNWAACESVFDKKCNRLGKYRLEEIICVWTWLRLQQALSEKALVTVLKPWIADLMEMVISFGIGSDILTYAASDTWPICLGYILIGEQGEIHGKEPGLAAIGLTHLKKCCLVISSYTQNIMA